MNHAHWYAQHYAPLPPACLSCHYNVAPQANKMIPASAWILSAVLLFLFFPLCWIPVAFMRDTEWRCPHCWYLAGRS